MWIAVSVYRLLKTLPQEKKSLVITLSGKKGLTPEQQKEILNTINQGNKNQFETSETSAVEPYIEQRH